MARSPSKAERANGARRAASASLRDYSAKRTFGATPEPAPAEPEARVGPLLFVVQQHSARRLQSRLPGSKGDPQPASKTRRINICG